MRQFRRAVVIGKFYPPHRGHHLLIDSALERSDEVTVILCVRPGDLIAGEVRRSWLKEMHPRADVLLVDDRYDANDTKVWAENTVRWLGRVPDAVFASEDYGKPYAELMGSVYVPVDPARIRVPCSATAVRADCFESWAYLAPPVRAWFAMRVCVLGAESTGTTTLAQALAAQYETQWVPEYGREYSEAKMERGEGIWRSDEFAEIAREQLQREEIAARSCSRAAMRSVMPAM